jgi:hypothetical protein
MKFMRRAIANALDAVARWIYPYASFEDDDTHRQGWEASFYFECTEKEASEVFERMSDVGCGADHPLCAVGGLHPSGWTLSHLDAQGLADEMRATLGVVIAAVDSAASPPTVKIREATAYARDKANAFDHAVLPTQGEDR